MKVVSSNASFSDRALRRGLVTTRLCRCAVPSVITNLHCFCSSGRYDWLGDVRDFLGSGNNYSVRCEVPADEVLEVPVTFRSCPDRTTEDFRLQQPGGQARVETQMIGVHRWRSPSARFSRDVEGRAVPRSGSPAHGVPHALFGNESTWACVVRMLRIPAVVRESVLAHAAKWICIVTRSWKPLSYYPSIGIAMDSGAQIRKLLDCIQARWTSNN